MLKTTIQKIKKITNFPGVISPPETVASQQSIFSIHFNLAIIVAIYSFYGDIVIALVSAGILLFNFRRHRKHNKPVKKTLLFVLLIICVVLFLGRFHGSTGGQSWMGLLALLINLKALESGNSRDHFVTVLMMFFLAAVIFAYNNSAVTPLILALYSISVLCSMMLLSHSRIPAQDTIHTKYSRTNSLTDNLKDLRKTWKPAGKLLLQALPITIILFFLFPRIQGSFGFLPDGDLNLNPSLGNSMDSGSFSNRSRSNELAFRVDILANSSGNIPNINPNNFYWRVKTFSTQRNFEWALHSEIDQQEAELEPANTASELNNTELIRYLITHQASADNYFPTLDTVFSSQYGNLLSNSTIKAKPQQSTFQYEASSIINSNTLLSSNQTNSENLTERQFKQYTQTVDIPGEKTEQLLNQWLDEVNLPKFKTQQLQPSPAQAKQLALMALRYFREQPFSYHLFPPEIEDLEPIEDFLFNTRSGYCEHYASTFSTLMRWMNIPTRVVAGFQGADYNELGGFYDVRYSTAHAWSEIWTKDDGWVRVDPTAAVAPERIEFGIDALLALMGENGQESFSRGDFQLSKLRDFISPSGSTGLLNQASAWFDAANHSWDKWVVNYDFEQQKKLLEKIGLESKNQYISLTVILFLILVVFLLLIFWLLKPKKIKKAPLDEFYALFKLKLKKIGVSISNNEGPETLRKKIIDDLPNFDTDINRIYDYYIENQYKNNTQNLHLFIQAVKRFNPKMS